MSMAASSHHAAMSSLLSFVSPKKSFNKQDGCQLNKTPGNSDSRDFCLEQALTNISMFTFRLVATWLRKATEIVRKP